MMVASCLRDIPVSEYARAHYEALRRPRAERIVRVGPRHGTYKAVDNRTAVWLRDLVVPRVLRVVATEKSMPWIYDYEIPWDTPAAQCTA